MTYCLKIKYKCISVELIKLGKGFRENEKFGEFKISAAKDEIVSLYRWTQGNSNLLSLQFHFSRFKLFIFIPFFPFFPYFLICINSYSYLATRLFTKDETLATTVLYFLKFMVSCSCFFIDKTIDRTLKFSGKNLIQKRIRLSSQSHSLFI